VVHRELAPLLGRTKNPTLAAEAEACLKQSLKTMETVWLKDSPFLDGRPQPSIADISCACELQQLKVSNFFLISLMDVPFHRIILVLFPVASSFCNV
jgi:hypothetical protein